MNTDEFANNWLNFARVQHQLKFAFIIFVQIKMNVFWCWCFLRL